MPQHDRPDAASFTSASAFEPSTLGAPQRRANGDFGLHGMRERLPTLRGWLDAALPAPGSGTPTLNLPGCSRRPHDRRASLAGMPLPQLFHLIACGETGRRRWPSTRSDWQLCLEPEARERGLDHQIPNARAPRPHRRQRACAPRPMRSCWRMPRAPLRHRQRRGLNARRRDPSAWRRASNASTTPGQYYGASPPVRATRRSRRCSAATRCSMPAPATATTVARPRSSTRLRRPAHDCRPRRASIPATNTSAATLPSRSTVAWQCRCRNAWPPTPRSDPLRRRTTLADEMRDQHLQARCLAVIVRARFLERERPGSADRRLRSRNRW